MKFPKEFVEKRTFASRRLIDKFHNSGNCTRTIHLLRSAGKMLQTELSVPKVHYDTAENELPEVEISTILMN